MTTPYSDNDFKVLYDFFLNAPIGLQLLDQDNVIRLTNAADLHMAGYNDEPAAYLNHRATEFHADAATAGALLESWAAGRPLENFRTRLRRRDGTEQPIVVYSNTRFEDGRRVNTRCVTIPEPSAPVPEAGPASHRAAETLDAMRDPDRRELFDVLDDLFENAPVALHIVGPDGLVRRANRMELESLGYHDAPERYIGHHIAEFHAEQPVIDDMLERLVGGRSLVHYHAKLVRRDGQTVPVVIYSSPRFQDGQFVNTRCFTLPRPVDASIPPPSFGWPRNDSPGGAGDDANPLTAALKRLAGRKAAEESLGFLAELGKVLTGGGLAAGCAAACRLAVPFLADFCAVELGSDDSAALLGAARGDGITGSEDLVRRAATGGAPRDGAGHTLRAPFVTGGGGAGAVVLVRRAAREPFGAADVALAEEVARRVAVAVELGQLRDRA